jgi:hypothetical protein
MIKVLPSRARRCKVVSLYSKTCFGYGRLAWKPPQQAFSTSRNMGEEFCYSHRRKFISRNEAVDDHKSACSELLMVDARLACSFPLRTIFTRLSDNAQLLRMGDVMSIH